MFDGFVLWLFQREREWDRRWYCTEATTSEEKNKRSYSTKVTIMFVVVTLIFIPCFVSCCLLAVCLTNSILSLVSFTLELLFLVCLFSFSPIFLQISDQSKSMRFNLIFILYFLLLLLLCVPSISRIIYIDFIYFIYFWLYLFLIWTSKIRYNMKMVTLMHMCVSVCMYFLLLFFVCFVLFCFV